MGRSPIEGCIVDLCLSGGDPSTPASEGVALLLENVEAGSACSFASGWGCRAERQRYYFIARENAQEGAARI